MQQWWLQLCKQINNNWFHLFKTKTKHKQIRLKNWAMSWPNSPALDHYPNSSPTVYVISHLDNCHFTNQFQISNSNSNSISLGYRLWRLQTVYGYVPWSGGAGRTVPASLPLLRQTDAISQMSNGGAWQHRRQSHQGTFSSFSSSSSYSSSSVTVIRRRRRRRHWDYLQRMTGPGVRHNGVGGGGYRVVAS